MADTLASLLTTQVTVVPTNRADTWTALKPILEDSGFSVNVTVFGVVADKELPAEIVATHIHDGTKLNIKLVAQDATGGTEVSVEEQIREIQTTDEKPELFKKSKGVNAKLPNAKWVWKVLERLEKAVEKR